MNTSHYKKLLRSYEKIRDDHTRTLQLRQQEVYTKIPRIAQIDQELSMTGIKISRTVLQSPSEAEKLIAALQEKNMDLTIEKAELLHMNGYPKDYLVPTYTCATCKDSGYAEGTSCKCLQQKLINTAYEQSNLKDVLAVENFDNFDFRYYSDVVDEKEGMSPRQNMQVIYSTCMNFVENYEQSFTNLLFYGPSGLGKTFLCNCIAKDLLDRGKTVLYLTAFQLFKLIEQERFHRNTTEEKSDLLDTIIMVDLLIIDDLGTEFSTILTSSELFNFLNTRLLDKKPTIISTNLPPNNWKNIYSDRITSRIHGNYKVLNFFGEDIRIRIKYKK